MPELVQEEVEDYTSKNDANNDAKEDLEKKKNEESGDIYQVSAKNQSLIQSNAQMRRSAQNLSSKRNSRQGSQKDRATSDNRAQNNIVNSSSGKLRDVQP